MANRADVVNSANVAKVSSAATGPIAEGVANESDVSVTNDAGAANRANAMNGLPHEQTDHADAQMHHHHTHGPHSHHAHGHHLLQVENLSVGFDMYEADKPFFKAKKKHTEVLHDLSLAVHEGEIVAVVGASGSGKTLLADSVMGLFEPNSTVTGSIWFDGKLMDAAGLAALRGNGLSLVPQGVSNLDPMMRVGKQVEGFAGKASRAERRARREQLFERYGLGPEVAKLYPHELSGGMARRVLLCCALMDNPRVIVADEPTPGLDLDLAVRALDDFRSFADAGNGVLLITHDINLALRVADRVAVFKDGTIVEETAVANFANPDTLRHPFTRQLWHALPEHDFAEYKEDKGTLLMSSSPGRKGFTFMEVGSGAADVDASNSTSSFGQTGVTAQGECAVAPVSPSSSSVDESSARADSPTLSPVKEPDGVSQADNLAVHDGEGE